jgi:WD40 repeat protein
VRLRYDSRFILRATLIFMCAGFLGRSQEPVSGPPEPVIQSGHSDQVLSLAFSTDGKMLVTASVDGTVKLRFAGTGQLVRTLPLSAYWAYSAAFSLPRTAEDSQVASRHCRH